MSRGLLGAQRDSSWECGLRGHASNRRAVVRYRFVSWDRNRFTEEGPSHRATTTSLVLAPAIVCRHLRPCLPGRPWPLVTRWLRHRDRPARFRPQPSYAGVSPSGGPGVKCQSPQKCLRTITTQKLQTSVGYHRSHEQRKKDKEVLLPFVRQLWPYGNRPNISMQLRSFWSF